MRRGLVDAARSATLAKRDKDSGPRRTAKCWTVQPRVSVTLYLTLPNYSVNPPMAPLLGNTEYRVPLALQILNASQNINPRPGKAVAVVLGGEG